jgi:hypothetical protein
MQTTPRGLAEIATFLKGGAITHLSSEYQPIELPSRRSSNRPKGLFAVCQSDGQPVDVEIA